MSKSVEVFEQTYKKPAQYTAFTPYRICPIGAHSDHQPGKRYDIGNLESYEKVKAEYKGIK